MSPFYDVSDNDTDSLSMLSGSCPRFAPSIASSATSNDWEMRSASPVPSVFSMTGSMRAAAYTLEYGRGLNNYSEIYRLPADDEEFERLDQQHVLFAEVMGKYPPPLPEVLADDTPGATKTCIDLGCGSGSWILDVARDFPHCSTVAVDLVPMQVLNMPANCRSEVDDINLGLQHFYGEFDVVHARLVSSGIRDYQGLVDQISQTLRPGGLVDLLEFDFRVYSIDKQPLLGQHAPSWLARWMNHCHMAVLTRGGEPDAANYLHGWMRDHGSFEDVVYRKFWFPTAPWRTGNDPESLRQNRIAQVFREDILAFLKSGRPLLLGTGLPEVVVNELEGNARRELLEARTPAYILVEHVYARKRRP
ncbi:S-adenosyl-L-methionine-dependent methyltransferase [Sparassis latifolia]